MHGVDGPRFLDIILGVKDIESLGLIIESLGLI